MARRARRANRNLYITPISRDSKDVTIVTLKEGDGNIPVGSVYKSNVQPGFEHDEQRSYSLLWEVQARIRTERSTTPALEQFPTRDFNGHSSLWGLNRVARRARRGYKNRILDFFEENDLQLLHPKESRSI
jgi:hypothetical protein